MSTFMTHIAVVLEFEAENQEAAYAKSDVARDRLQASAKDLFNGAFQYAETEGVEEQS